MTSRTSSGARGTVPMHAASYVQRKADTDLLTALQGGDYCFALNSRQMGKSSLSVRTIAKLNAAGIQKRQCAL